MITSRVTYVNTVKIIATLNLLNIISVIKKLHVNEIK